jgi:hypothetical protein
MELQEMRKVAQDGLGQLKIAAIEYLAINPQGVLGADVAKALALQSTWKGGWKNSLVWEVLAVLVNEGMVVGKKQAGHRRFFLVSQARSGA